MNDEAASASSRNNQNRGPRYKLAEKGRGPWTKHPLAQAIVLFILERGGSPEDIADALAHVEFTTTDQTVIERKSVTKWMSTNGPKTTNREKVIAYLKEKFASQPETYTPELIAEAEKLVGGLPFRRARVERRKKNGERGVFWLSDPLAIAVLESVQGHGVTGYEIAGAILEEKGYVVSNGRRLTKPSVGNWINVTFPNTKERQANLKVFLVRKAAECFVTDEHRRTAAELIVDYEKKQKARDGTFSAEQFKKAIFPAVPDISFLRNTLFGSNSHLITVHLGKVLPRYDRNLSVSAETENALVDFINISASPYITAPAEQKKLQEILNKTDAFITAIAKALKASEWMPSGIPTERVVRIDLVLSMPKSDKNSHQNSGQKGASKRVSSWYFVRPPESS